ncbi:MAG TPA: hemolysin family protein [Pirellulales bacterium]|jgi:CBS domain containing-hemolysin-like protein|nr:hemolysin family protein [Pirellulales bacterium]
MSDLHFWWAALCFAISGGAALGARALLDFSRIELQKLCQEHDREELFSTISHDDVQVAEGLRIWQMLSLTLALISYVFAVLNHDSAGFEGQFFSHSLAWGVLLLIVVLVEIWLPQIVARTWSAPFVYRLWPVWRTAATLALPVSGVTRILRGVIQRVSGRPQTVATEETLEAEIRTIVSEGEREGLLEEEARDMIEGVFELTDADVARIMTPRTEIYSLALDSTWDEAVSFAVESGHSRIPVYGKNRDDIVGVLHVKDLFLELAKPAAERRPFKNLLRKPYHVPETKAVSDLLQEFQRKRNHLAIVLDEYGGVSGVVTIEDVLEEIVGEIDDEYDENPIAELQQVGEGRWEALGRTRIQDINEELGLDLPEEAEFDTLAGFAFHELGQIPHVGQELVWKNIKLRVLDASRRRIDRLLLEILPEPAEKASDAAAESEPR